MGEEESNYKSLFHGPNPEAFGEERRSHKIEKAIRKERPPRPDENKEAGKGKKKRRAKTQAGLNDADGLAVGSISRIVAHCCTTKGSGNYRCYQ